MSKLMQISIKWDRIIKENSLQRISQFLTQEAGRVLGWILVPVPSTLSADLDTAG